jgi:hypothetical protein
MDRCRHRSLVGACVLVLSGCGADAPAANVPASSATASPAPASRPVLAGFEVPDLAKGLPELEGPQRAIADGRASEGRARLEALLATPALRWDLALAARALVARAFDADRVDGKAAELYAQVVAEARASNGDGTPEQLSRAADALGEALFHRGEVLAREADRQVFPTYGGDGSRESMMRFMNREVAAWIRAKSAALENTENAFIEIPKAKLPSPHWLVLAGFRVGDLWARFVLDFRNVPMPKEWLQNGPIPGIPDLTWAELRATFRETLVEKSEPQAERARKALAICIAKSKAHAILPGRAARCRGVGDELDRSGSPKKP